MTNLAADLDGRLRALERELGQLAAERQRYLDLFASAPEACVVTDAHGTILEANALAEELLEAKGATCGTSIDAFVPLEQRRLFQSLTSAALAGGGRTRVPGSLRRRKGDLRVEFSVSVVRRERAPARLFWIVRPLGSQGG